VVGALLKSLRPHQWVKNVFVAFPLLFSKNLLDPHYAVRTLAAFGLFSLLSGTVYLVNDLFDIEKDRSHPKKCQRPIASGRLPVGVARSAAAVMILIGLGLSFLVGLPFFACAAGYLVLNLVYSLSLKHVPFVDVICLASFFLLRVEAGALAISVPASPWLLICTFVLAAYLGFGKRAHELATAGARAGEQRAVLSRYSLGHLKVIMWVLAAASCASYVAYTVSPHVRTLFGTNKLLYTAPFAAFGVVRFLILVSKKASADSPTDEMLRDLPFMANGVLFAVAIVAVIYFL
jgi:decaprenyl-phosphate phosphoribosyltransferase